MKLKAATGEKAGFKIKYRLLFSVYKNMTFDKVEDRVHLTNINRMEITGFSAQHWKQVFFLSLLCDIWLCLNTWRRSKKKPPQMKQKDIEWSNNWNKNNKFRK
jgi:hypothetical protein